MDVQLLKNGIPHDAVILTKNKNLDDFKPSKVLSVPSSSSPIYPWEVEIHLTGKCNLLCKGCSYASRHLNTELSIEDLEKIFYSIRNMGSHTLFFSGGGDPLCWNYWTEIIKLKNDIIPNVVTGISTNLCTEKGSDYINTFFDLVQVHVVGYDVSSCLENTNVDCFEILDRQLSLLNHPNIVLKILINSKNQHQITNYLSYIERFDANTVVLKKEQNFNRYKQASDNNFLLETSEIVAKHHISINYPHIFNTQTDMNALIMPTKCHIVDRHLYCLIRENGDVYPCIASTYSKKNCVGNIHNKSLEAIYEKDIDVSSFTKNMHLKDCPLGACRHFRFDQELELAKNRTTSSCKSVPNLL